MIITFFSVPVAVVNVADASKTEAERRKTVWRAADQAANSILTEKMVTQCWSCQTRAYCVVQKRARESPEKR